MLFFGHKERKKRKRKDKNKKKERKEKKRKKEKKSLGVLGGEGGVVCLVHILSFFFLTAFPTRCQCRGALLASHAAWRKYLPTFNLVGDAAPHQNEDGQQLRPTAWLAPAAMLLYIGTRWGTVSSLALQPPLSSLVSFSSTLALSSLLSFTCWSLLTQ